MRMFFRASWLAVGVSVAGVGTLAAQTIVNGSFELPVGAFPGGSPTFLGGLGADYTGQTGQLTPNGRPQNWEYNGGTNGSRDTYVFDASPSRAAEGNYFVFVSSTGATSYPGNAVGDDCLRQEIAGIKVGVEYTITLCAADAGSVTTTPYVRFELDLDRNGSAETLSPMGVQTGASAYAVTTSTGWVTDTSEAIPWQTYSFAFTMTPAIWNANTTRQGNLAAGTATASITFWLSANTTNSAQAASLVFDCVEIVPEPADYAMWAGAGSFGLLAFARRRRP